MRLARVSRRLLHSTLRRFTAGGLERIDHRALEVGDFGVIIGRFFWYRPFLAILALLAAVHWQAHKFFVPPNQEWASVDALLRPDWTPTVKDRR